MRHGLVEGTLDFNITGNVFYIPLLPLSNISSPPKEYSLPPHQPDATTPFATYFWLSAVALLDCSKMMNDTSQVDSNACEEEGLQKVY